MTKYVVNRLINEFEKAQFTVDCLSIENAQISQLDLSQFDLLGIAYPVHAFNAPKIVVNFVKQLPVLSRLDTFIIGTMGEESVVNFASSDTLIKRLGNKGYAVFYNRLLEMPSNFIVKYDEPRVRLILGKIDRDIPDIAKEITHLTAHQLKTSFAARFLRILGKTEWLGAPLLGKFFYADSGCSHCCKCVKNCPNCNIEEKGKAVHFKWRCGLCMRCIYQCPNQAISIRQPFKSLRFDEWYNDEIFTEQYK